MFHRVTIRVGDRPAVEPVYRALLATLGHQPTRADERTAEWDDFAIAQGDPPTTGLHVGFVAPGTEAIEAFWRTGLELGWRDDGAPGPRPQYRHDYVGGFLLDPDGNSIEAVHHGGLRKGGIVDHLWIRVADLAAARGFYATVGPRAGFTLHDDTPERATYRGTTTGTFSLIAGRPLTRGLHMAFPAEGAASLTDPDANTIELVDDGRSGTVGR